MSKFWWFLRDCWHKPNFMNESSANVSFYWGEMPEGQRWQIRHALSLYRIHPAHIKRDVKSVLRWAFWKLLWIQPFRCNGNKGGWRTKFCDWLENKARGEE